MTKEEYQEYLKSDHWKKTKARKLTERNYRCERCGSPYMLCVHHLNYDRLWKELMTDLKVYCDYCHKTVHGIPTGNQRPIIPKHIRDEQLKGIFNIPRKFKRGKLQKLPKIRRPGIHSKRKKNRKDLMPLSQSFRVSANLKNPFGYKTLE